MSDQTYYLTHADGRVEPVLWDGVALWDIPEGATVSATPPPVLPEPEGVETPEQLMARVHAETDLLYEGLPIEVQGVFLPVYAGVKDAIARGKFRQARAAVIAQSVPESLEQAKAAILAAIPEND